MADEYWQAMNTLGQAIQSSAGMLSAADLSAKNRDFYEKQYAKQRAFNREERWAAEEYNTSERLAVQQWNEGMWNRQNEYNSPSSQMERMIAAGINPNNAAMAIAGGSSSASVNGVSPQSSPSASASAPGMPQQFNPAQSYAEMMNSYTMAMEQRSQARLNDSVAQKTEEETKGLVIDNNYKPFEKEADLTQAYQKVALMVQQGQLSEAQAFQIIDMLPLLKGKTVADIYQIQETCANLQEQRNQIVEQIRLLGEQIETEKHKQKQMDAAAYQAYMNGLESKSAIDLNGKKMSLAEAETKLKELEKQRGDFDFNIEQDLYKRYGWKPGDKQVDRVLDTLGKNISFIDDGFQNLWDSAKTQLNSLGSSGRSFLNKAKSFVKNPFNSPKKDYPLDIDDYGRPNP